jgi:hypothetical protein
MSTDSRTATYVEGWHRHLKEPLQTLSKDQALRRDKQGRPYAVVVGDPAAPRCFIEVNKDYFGVGFLDEHRRECLRYGFEEVKEGVLFLTEVVVRNFLEGTDQVRRGVVYRCSPEGTASIERSGEPFEKLLVETTTADTSGHWEPKPAFGEYDSLVRRERGVRIPDPGRNS